MRRFLATSVLAATFGLPAMAAMTVDATNRFCILCPW